MRSNAYMWLLGSGCTIRLKIQTAEVNFLDRGFGLRDMIRRYQEELIGVTVLL